MTRIGAYVCHCGLNIAGVVDVEKVVGYARSLPDVVVVRDYTYMCSESGQRMIQDDIKSCTLDRVVIATCSPRMHEETFRRAVKEAGLNPYLLEIVNLREHVSWAHTEEPEKATEKAKDLVRMGVARSRCLESLQGSKVRVEKSVLVVGGGIAGIQATLDLANAGLNVVQVEKTPSIGGKMALLDKTFPTLDCSACILTPKMTEVVRHPNIRLITCADVENVSGYVGNYEVTLLKKPRYVDEAKCTGCGECPKECTVEMLNEFELGLGERKAIFRPFPQAAPNVFAIDKRGTPQCRAACPAGVNAQGYIALITKGKFNEALELVRRDIPFPGVCGRVCFHPCEAKCERGKVDEPLAIKALKRFVSDYELKNGKKQKATSIPKTHKERIAVIGSGPSGLTAAYELARKGYPVTVFESLPEPGGMLRVGIPNYRLPKNVLDAEIEYIKDLGVEIRTNVLIGKDLMFSELLRDHDATFIATGMHKGARLGIDGGELKGVVNAIDFLRKVNLGKKIELGARVAVICVHRLLGIEATRVALRLGPKEVNLIYRKSRKNMLYHERIGEHLQKEVETTESEGARIHFMTWPTKILGKDGRVIGIECAKIMLGEPDENGRRQFVPIKGSEFIMEADAVILAIGQAPDISFLPKEVELTERNTVKVDPVTLETSLPGIFAGGEVESGPSTVIASIAAGKRAAVSIDRHLRGEDLKVGREEEIKLVKEVSKEGVEKKARKFMPLLPAEKRIRSFEEVETGFKEEMAVQEAERCLNCGGCSECLECIKVCKADAINHKQIPQRIRVKVGGIILATGSELFDAAKIQEFGFGKSKNIITNLQFERLSNAAGPTGGKILCPETNTPPKSVVFIQCIGSRDKRFHEYCCRIGCMATLKQAILTREKLGKDVRIYVCFNDIRAFGKGYEEFYRRAREMDIDFIGGIPSEIRLTADSLLHFEVYDRGTNKLLEINPDLVVLANCLIPDSDLGKISALFHASRSSDGFLLEAHPKLRPLESAMAGVFLAGACQGPKDIPDSVAQASGAAGKAIDLLSSGEIELEPLKAVVDEDLCSGCRLCESICSFIAIEMKNKIEGGTERLRAEVIDAVCQGCGLCAATCPTHAIKMHHYTYEQITAQIQAACLETRGGS